MACYFWVLLDDKFSIEPPYPPCEACGSTMPNPVDWNEMDQGCPNCGAGGLTEADLLAIQYEDELYRSVDWEKEEYEHYNPDICFRCKGRYNAVEWGLYSGLCQKCVDADALKDAYSDEIG